MNILKENDLNDRYAHLMDEPLYYECGDGWYHLIDSLFKQCPEGTKILQVKEKFGLLRVYLDGPELAHRLAYNAEKLSRNVCEYCGAEGKIRQGSWIKTLCDTCHKGGISNGN